MNEVLLAYYNFFGKRKIGFLVSPNHLPRTFPMSNIDGGTIYLLTVVQSHNLSVHTWHAFGLILLCKLHKRAKKKNQKLLLQELVCTLEIRSSTLFSIGEKSTQLSFFERKQEEAKQKQEWKILIFKITFCELGAWIQFWEIMNFGKLLILGNILNFGRF